jgi:hypothetical protein
VKKTAIALALSFALLVSLVIEVHIVRVAKANPYQGADHPTWRFFSPKNQTAYNTDSLNFNFTCTTNDVWDEYYNHIDLEYIIDGPDYYNGSTYVMPYTDDRVFIEAHLVSEALSGMGNVSRKVFEYSTQLINLSDGQHTLTIYKEFNTWGPGTPFVSTEQVTVFFSIETSTLESKPQFDLRIMQAYLYGNSCSLTYNITNSLGKSSSNRTVIEVYSIELFSNGNLLGSKGQGFFVGDHLDSETLLALTSHIPYAISGISSINYNGSKLKTDALQLSHSLNSQDLSGTVLLRVERLGLIIVEDESVDDNLSSGELVDEIMLERHGDGFLYDVLPEPTPTMPNMGPTSAPPYFDLHPEFVYLIIMLPVVIAVGFGFWLYFKKRGGDKSP